MRLYLIRHAQSQNNILGPDTIGRRQVDPDLTPLGYQQRDKLARHLERAETDFAVDELYTSAMYRSLLTTLPLSAALGLQPSVWTALHELGGMYHAENGVAHGRGGMARSAILDQFPGYALPEAISEAGWYDVVMGYEPIDKSVERALAVAATLREWSKTRSALAMVSHAGFLNLLLSAIFGDLPMRPGWRFYHNNTAVTRVDYVDGEPRLHFMNRVEHLPADFRSF